MAVIKLYQVEMTQPGRKPFIGCLNLAFLESIIVRKNGGCMIRCAGIDYPTTLSKDKVISDIEKIAKGNSR